MQSIKETEKEIIEEFELFDDWADKYQYIIELGQKLEPLDEKYKTNDLRIKGCQSSVWLNASVDNGKIKFTADSDSTFVKGEIALLIRVLSNRTPDEIVEANLSFIDTIGLKQHIAVTRANGLAAMIKQMKLYAIGLKATGVNN